jgi:hypothetical protein
MYDQGDGKDALVWEDGVELWHTDLGDEISLRGVSDRGESLFGAGPSFSDSVVLVDRQGRPTWEQPAAEYLWRMAWFPGGDRFLVMDFDIYLRRYTVWRIVR